LPLPAIIVQKSCCLETLDENKKPNMNYFLGPENDMMCGGRADDISPPAE
jgi:hypothetical protein